MKTRKQKNADDILAEQVEKYISENPQQAKRESVSDHTPTPWKIGEDGDIFDKDSCFNIANIVDALSKEGMANAAFIVKAVNSHEELLDIVKENHGMRKYPDHIKATCSICRAIARAEGKE